MKHQHNFLNGFGALCLPDPDGRIKFTGAVYFQEHTLTYNSAYHRFTILLACLAFLLVIAGGLVTSENAGLAVPDWPTSFGSLIKIPPMIGGVKFEHGHRMLGWLVGF